MEQVYSNYLKAKHEFERYAKNFNDLISHYKETFAKEIDYWSPESVKNLNKLKTYLKKQIVIAIFFGKKDVDRYESSIHLNSNFSGKLSVGYSHKNKYRDAYNYNSCTEYIDGGFIVDLSNKEEIECLFQSMLTKDIWKLYVEKGCTTLGYVEWKNEFDRNFYNKKENFYSYNNPIFEKWIFSIVQFKKLFSNKFLIVHPVNSSKNNNYSYAY